ncbi:MAG: thiamine ABC transporter substrate-binding protein [Actinomycetaceae bacterium]|nr:thiamine ABC transporter substrate-binding protein [Actinomycetaceae bacterium]
MLSRKTRFASLIALSLLFGLTACGSATAKNDGTAGASSNGSTTLNVLVHSSFALDEAHIAAFEKENNLKVKLNALDNGGAMTSQLILTKDAPLGDVAFGVDNINAYRALKEGVFATPDTDIPGVDEQYLIDGNRDLTPVDIGDVCINIDKQWFLEKNQPSPTSLDDLIKPEYRDLTVAMSPVTSTPGIAFFFATVSKFGQDGWKDYWTKLKDNGLKITDGWTEAYNVDYSAGEGEGPRPIMVSYASSPTAAINEAGTDTRTTALLDTCFRQIEYAGILKNAKNPEGAAKFLEFLMSPKVQETIPDQMYMYPAALDAKISEELSKFGPLSPAPLQVSPKDISDNKDTWLREWSDLVIG